jgi:hypothetical protein
MNANLQSEIMLRFAHTSYERGCNTYDKADCAGAVQLMLRDFADIDLPDDRLTWVGYFDLLDWPCDLKPWDVLLLAHSNTLQLVDHVALHLEDDWICQLGKDTGGMICERLNRYSSKILYVGRYKH